MKQFTELEQKVLDSLISQLYAEAGFSDVDANDISRDIKIDNKIVRGALASLVKKGVVDVEETNTFGASQQYSLIYLRQEYWHLHPEWKNECTK
jgi:predicted transcriptional regulator